MRAIGLTTKQGVSYNIFPTGSNITLKCGLQSPKYRLWCTAVVLERPRATDVGMDARMMARIEEAMGPVDKGWMWRWMDGRWGGNRRKGNDDRGTTMGQCTPVCTYTYILYIYWDIYMRLCVYIYICIYYIHIHIYVGNDDVSVGGWSHVVAAVASIHHSQRLFVVAGAPNEIFNLKAATL